MLAKVGSKRKPTNRPHLKEHGCADRVTLVQAGHETMAAAAPAILNGRTVRAVCFNLGYLPGGDKRIITRPNTTLAALRAALELIVPDGVVTAVLYPGHKGGDVERDAVMSWAATLAADGHRVEHYTVSNRTAAPELIVIEKECEQPTRA